MAVRGWSVAGVTNPGEFAAGLQATELHDYLGGGRIVRADSPRGFGVCGRRKLATSRGVDGHSS
jgi:hypothetical protein